MNFLGLILLPLVFLWDKVILLLFLFEKIDELKAFRNLQRAINPAAPSLESIWSTLVESQLKMQNSEIKKIYKLNSSILFDWSVRRINYYVKYHFWSLLDFFEIDTWGWKNEDVFGRPSLITYGIIKNNKEIKVVVVSLQNQQYMLLKSHSLKRLPLWKFKRRQLVYDADKGFLAV